MSQSLEKVFFKDKVKKHSFLCHLCHYRIRLVTLTIWSLGLVLLVSAELVLTVHPSSPEPVDWPFQRQTVCHHSPRWATWTFPRVQTCHFETFEWDCSNKKILRWVPNSKKLPDARIRLHLADLGLGDPVRPPASYLATPQLWFFIFQNQKRKIRFSFNVIFRALIE